VGRNPLVVFVGMVLLEIVLTRWVEAVPLGNQTVTLWAYIFERGFRPWLGPPKLASLVVSLLHLLLWTAVAGALHRANLFVTL
jgi:predicted acyltransferase